MTIVRTKLNMIENARRVRVELINGLTALDVQNALQELSQLSSDSFRIVTSSGNIIISSTDVVILVNKSAGSPTSIILPPSSTRIGPVTAKDLKGDANTNNITFVPASGETIDGFSAAAAAANGVALIDVNYGKKTLYPLLNGGWYI